MSKLSAFLNLYTSDSTVKTYKYALYNFFTFIYPDVKDTSQSQRVTVMDQLSDRYITEERDYEADIQGYLKNISPKPPKTVKLYLAAVKNFLIESEVELTQRFWRRLMRRFKGSEARIDDKVPSNEELKHILMHVPIQGQALFLTLVSSGMRIGEALQLTIDDINFQVKPIKVNIRGEITKSGDRRTTFISSEAGDALHEWLKVRDQYLITAAGRSHQHEKSITDPRLFPFEVATAYSMWKSALDKTGNGVRDKSTNRRKIHPHVLRKFFRSALPKVINRDYVEVLMGHKGYPTDEYRHITVEDLAENYQLGEHLLIIFGNGSDVGKLRAEVEEKSQQLQILVNGLTTENLSMKERLQGLTEQNTQLEKTIQSLKEHNEDQVSDIRAQMEAQIQQLQTQNEKFSQQIDDLLHRYADENMKLSDYIGDLINRNVKLEEQMKRMESRIVELVRSNNHESYERLKERLQRLYFLYLQSQIPKFNTATEAELRVLDAKLRETDSFYREVFDESIVQKFAEWRREDEN
ncbi:MAG: tyrosine-type recombinase/integrase [Candidatus Bathyarchaeota archaeon]|nr:tyrosine-type recombinase/integrase [Candidatus Bathyarchaeota archaeon]